jgi:mRNA degradation ribonuclease J1/J2
MRFAGKKIRFSFYLVGSRYLSHKKTRVRFHTLSYKIREKMCLISDCVIIDEFTLRIPSGIYILTHWHSDHYQGIIHSWSYGPIYASKVTRNLLLTKFPKLHEKVTELPLRRWTKLNERI